MPEILTEFSSPFLHLEAGTKIELILIPAGKFRMGSANEYFSEAPIHEVNVPRPFYLGKWPITQRQWIAAFGQNPSQFQLSPDHPVDNLTWSDATRFCDHLSVLVGRRVRLPSEAEWEYACRAGTTGEYFTQEGSFVDDNKVHSSIRRQLREFAWFDENSRGTTHPVGLKQPNPWGLHDMIGNVWEWCADHWHGSYEGAPFDNRPWIKENPERPLRCLRGGAWDMNAFRCRSTYRSWDWEDLATNRFGLRICVE